MKVAITGKGGVGKTTLSSTLARLYAGEGRPVLAADVDPDANLGLALGLSQEEVDAIVPISKMRTLVEERTGANEANKFFKLNPYVADIPEKYAKDVNGVKLLVMGTVEGHFEQPHLPERRRGHFGHGGRPGTPRPGHCRQHGSVHRGGGAWRPQRPDLCQRQASGSRPGGPAGPGGSQQGARPAGRGVCPQRHPGIRFPGLYPLQPRDHGRRPAGEVPLRLLPCGNRGHQEN